MKPVIRLALLVGKYFTILRVSGITGEFKFFIVQCLAFYGLRWQIIIFITQYGGENNIILRHRVVKYMACHLHCEQINYNQVHINN